MNKLKRFFRIEYISIFLYLLFLPLVWQQMKGEHIFPELINLVFFTVTTYGILIVVAVLIGIFILTSIRPRELDEIDIFVASIWVITPAFILARLWHVATDFYLYSDNLATIFRINSGGLSIWGALVGGIIGLTIFSWLHGFSIHLVSNLVVVVVPFGQAIGRFGNLINQELFGPPTSSILRVFIEKTKRPAEYIDYKYFHPTFLYESFLCFLLFITLLLLWKYLVKKRIDLLEKSFIMISVYLIVYGIIRFSVEFFRLENHILLFFSFNQVLSLSFILLGSIIFYKSLKTS